MFEHRPRPQCSWTGLAPDGVRAVPCGRVAEGFVEARDGRRVYACEEHVGHAREQAGGGRFIRGFLPEDAVPPPTHHAVSRQAHDQATVVGGAS